MATITGYTAERMKVTEDASIVDGEVDGTDLILKQKDGTLLNVGDVQGTIGVDGPPGGIPEAPIDGNPYFRKNESWQQTPFIPEAPNDNVAYNRKDADWIRVNHPWTLELNESSGIYPGGFSKLYEAVSLTWEMLFSGTGYMVAFSFRFFFRPEDYYLAHFTLPTLLRPVDNSDHDAFVSLYTPEELNGITRMRIAPNGFVSGPRNQTAITLKQEPSLLAGDGIVSQFRASTVGDLCQVQMSGAYIRNTKALPSLATFI